MDEHDPNWRPGESYYERKSRRNAEMIKPLLIMFAIAIILIVLALLGGCANTVWHDTDDFDESPFAETWVKEYWECGNVSYVCLEDTGPPLTRALECELITSDITYNEPNDCHGF